MREEIIRLLTEYGWYKDEIRYESMTDKELIKALEQTLINYEASY